MIGGIIQNVRDVVVLIVLFGVTIFIHELGHFLVALRCGLVVETFSIGFGPAIWRKKVKGIVYKIGCIPFGGYVALPQIDPSGMSTVQGDAAADQVKEATDKEPPGEAGPRPIPAVSPWKKLLVVLAGVTGNMLLAVVLAWVIYLAPGADVGAADTAIGYVATDSVAYARGIRPGDEILAVNGEDMNTWNEYLVLCLLGSGGTNAVTLTVQSGESVREIRLPMEKDELGMYTVQGIGKPMACMIRDVIEGQPAETAGLLEGDIIEEFAGTAVAGTAHFVDLVAAWGARRASLTIERDGRKMELAVTPAYNSEYERAVIGVHVGDAESGIMPWMQFKDPWLQIKYDASQIFRILRALMTPREAGRAGRGLGGPIMIIATLWAAIKSNILNAVGFLRLVNVNLAILNLLPIPVLDGGHIVFALWEGITRRRPNPKFVNVLVNICAFLLIGALLLLSWVDIRRFGKIRRVVQERVAAQEMLATNDTASAEAIGQDEP